MRSIGDGVMLAMAAVGICCGATLLLAVGAGALAFGFTTTGLVGGLAFTVLSLALLAVRRLRHRDSRVR
ncbi:MAG: hypothetical protein ACRDM0_17875 [Thermoleophilaceae bacterium]